MPRIDELLHYLHDKGGSDLHLAAGLEPRVRISGSLRAVPGWDILSYDAISDLLRELAPKDHWRNFEIRRDVDFAYGLESVARFRVNYFFQHHGPAAVMRIIPERIMTLAELNAPAVLDRFTTLRSGLVLVTGPTGSGKSTTLAAIINKINTEQDKHIVTIEDPIEFLHPPKKSMLSQREVGKHTQSFAAALRSSIRQNPDVVLVGEMRDHETIALAITAAEMGTLVFGTLHTNSAVKTIDRLIDSFPAAEQQQARTSLSQSLFGVVAQLLLPTADGKGRVASHEILLRTSALPNIIREGNTSMLLSIIQNGKGIGMQTMDDSLMELLKKGKIKAVDAFLKSHNKARFEKLVPVE